MSDSESQFELGDVVVDKEHYGSDPKQMVVVNRPPVEASEWEVRKLGRTVAEDNPEYPDDDRVVVVLFKSDLEAEYPYYTGAFPIRLSRINRDDAKFYAFPESRLEAVDSLDSVKIGLDEIFPSPYHARNFDVEENRSWIAEIDRYENPIPFPLVRDCGDHFEIINGHKRVWASHLLDLAEIYVECAYIGDEKAAVQWSRLHLPDYDTRERHEALSRLTDRFGDGITESRGFPDLTGLDDSAELATSAGGENE